jgi:hypothetical protein
LVLAVSTALAALAQNSAGPSPLPENLALRAAVSASSEYNTTSYAARFAVDGQIPGAGSQAEDQGRAWCVQGDTHRQGATFTFEWPEPVTVATLVYWGRTAWFAEECWKGYELRLDGAAEPVARGEFRQGHGPQLVVLPTPSALRKLVLTFTSSYGGANPGASEIQVYGEALTAERLPAFRALSAGPPSTLEFVEVKETPELRRQLLAGELGFQRLALIRRHELNPSHVYTQHVEGFQAGGGLYTWQAAAEGGVLTRLVDSPDGEILDCDVSYDGTEILFSWRQTPELGYQLFRVQADGSGLTRITDGPHHNYNACWLPDGGIAFLSTRRPQFAYCWVSPVGTLCRIQPDGSDFRELSANYLNDFTPSVLNDGRIVYGRWEYVDRPAIPIQSLWSINPDGTGLAVYYGNRVLSPATFLEPRAIPNSTRVMCILTAHNGPCRGGLGVLDRRYGVNAQEAILNLTPEIDIGRVDQGSGNNVRGPFENPWPLDEKHLLISLRGTAVVRDWGGAEQAIIARPDDGCGYYSPQPLQPRFRPPAIPSTLPVEAPADADGTRWATLVLQDVYRGLAPQVRRGEVARLRIIEEMGKAVRADLNHRAFGFQFPVISCGATYACKKVWGEVEVAADGSACFQVPAGVPLYFEALDGTGRALQRMRSFTHLMPGETQSCIGCHEPRAGAAAPGRPASATLPAVRPTVPEWGGPKGFSYAEVVQPVLDRHCVSCHAPPTPAGRLDLSADLTDFFNVSYDTLARGREGGQFGYGSPYVSWIPTYNGHEGNILQIAPKTWGSPASRLADVILSGHPDRDGKPRLQLDDAARRRVFAWIDLNVPYYGTSETSHPDREGCRRIYPADLDRVLEDVGRRRCGECHANGAVPRAVWTRITQPQWNTFLTAPLAKAAGGSEACGRAVFASPDDPDYRAILRTFEPAATELKARPRTDMPGAVADTSVNRSCL